MNGRKAKVLRRQAESMSVGKAACEYERIKDYSEYRKTNIPISIKKETTRGVYLVLKKRYIG